MGLAGTGAKEGSRARPRCYCAYGRAPVGARDSRPASASARTVAYRPELAAYMNMKWAGPKILKQV